MNVFIIAALSADGFIARRRDEFADWTSKEDKRRFVERTKRAGVVVIGRTTFETIGKSLPGRRMIVYTSKKITIPGVECTNESPQMLIERLEREGVRELAICGGASIYTLFIKSGLVRTLYLTIEPLIFGKGIRLFNESIPATLTLVSSEQKEQSVFLEYKLLSTE